MLSVNHEKIFRNCVEFIARWIHDGGSDTVEQVLQCSVQCASWQTAARHASQKNWTHVTKPTPYLYVIPTHSKCIRNIAYAVEGSLLRPAQARKFGFSDKIDVCFCLCIIFFVRYRYVCNVTK